MNQKLLLVALMSATLAISTTAQAERAGTTAVKVQSSMSVSEIRQYVENVDRRFQKGRYDVSSKRDQEWMIQIIAALRQELEAADSARDPSPKLRELASEFETGVIGIEEGGIVCRQERKVGTRMATQRCFSRKRQIEDNSKSQESLRQMRKGQGLVLIPPNG
ncbi:MAG: hypothetical protein AB7E72_09370 [Lysobacterales bacterium]